MIGERTLTLLQDIQEGHSIQSSVKKRGTSKHSIDCLISNMRPKLKEAIRSFQLAQYNFQLEIDKANEKGSLLTLIQDIQRGHSFKSHAAKRKGPIESIGNSTMRKAIETFQAEQKTFQLEIERSIQR